MTIEKMLKAYIGGIGGILGLMQVGAQAAPNTELQVQGAFQRAGCQVLAQNGGRYDFGVIPRASSDTPQVLPAMTQRWGVRCENDTYLSLTPEDNRGLARSDAAKGRFGLGMTDNGAGVGYFELGVSQVRQDASVAVLKGRQANPGQAVSPLLLPGQRLEWVRDGMRRSGKDYALDITVKPYLTGQNSGASVVLDGSVTMNFEFGL